MTSLRFLTACALSLAVAAFCACTKEEQSDGTDGSNPGASASISSSNSYFTPTGEGGTIAFKSSGGSVNIFVDCGVDWFVQNNASDAFSVETDLKAGIATVTAGQNRSSQELSGVLTFSTSDDGYVFATVTVTQNAYGAPEITVASNEVSIPAFGDGLTVEVGVESTIGDYDVAKTNGKWLTVTKTDAGLSLTAEENGETDRRTATLTLTANDGYRSDEVEIAVTQDGVAYITLETDDITAAAAGDVLSVAVESNFDLGWEIGEDASWLSIEADAAGLVITVAQNETVNERETVVTVTAGDGAQNNAEALLTVYQEADNPDSFILEYSIQQAGQKITLPLYGTVDCRVNWGDGTVQTVNGTYPSHTYQEGRIFDVTVTGTVTKLYGKDLDDLSKTLLTNVVQWGNTGLEDVSYAFYQTNVRSLPADTRGAFAKLTSFEYVFRECASLSDISADLLAYGSKITSLRTAFYKCTSVETLPEGLLRNCTNLTTVYDAFASMTSLTEVREDLFSTCTKIYEMSFVFSGDKSLGTLPENIFANCPNVTTFYGAFEHCAFQEIPAGLFKNNTKVTAFNFTFYACSSIKEIPAGLFDSCPNVTTFADCFYQCTSLETVADGLFDNCPNVTNFSSLFMYCSALKAIPDGLFKNNSKVTYISDCFWQCFVIERVPDGLFDAFSSVTNFEGVFCYCYKLAYVPEDLFKNCTAATNFKYAFNQCLVMTALPTVSYCTHAQSFENAFSLCSAITEIPEGYFDNCTEVTSFYSTFSSDSKLTSIPAGLFDKCTAVETFYGVFSSCTGLTEIPDGLFKNCTSATSFSGAFNKCSGITSVKEDIFYNCPKASNFSYVFAGTSISAIPEGIFANSSAATDLSYVFANCVNVTEIPENVFAGNTLATTFADAFYGCTGIKEIPENLFANNTKATNFYATFAGCTGLTEIPAALFDNNTKVINFTYTFLQCTNLADESPYTEIDGVKVHLYERKNYTGRFTTPTNYSNCFEGCDGLSDLAAIKSAGWY